MEGPGCKKSRAGIAMSGLPKLRMDGAMPECARSDADGNGRSLVRPRAGEGEPSFPMLCGGESSPNLMRSSTGVGGPKRAPPKVTVETPT